MGGMGSILGMGAMLQKVFIPSYVPVWPQPSRSRSRS